MTATDDVPAFDPAEDGHARLGLGLERVAVQELALETGDEGFAHGVVVGVANGSHRGEYACLPASLAERYGRVLGPVVGVVNHPGGLPLGHVYDRAAHTNSELDLGSLADGTVQNVRIEAGPVDLEGMARCARQAFLEKKTRVVARALVEELGPALVEKPLAHHVHAQSLEDREIARKQ